MPESIVRSRIDPKVKKEANRVFHKMGLTMSDAIRLFLYRVISEKGLPFSTEIPNKETIAAMEEVRKGEGLETVTLEDIRKQWNEA
jgi:DNA-damage-inducible protein J